MKRKNNMSSHSSINTKRRHRPILKLENVPPVNSIKELIEIGKTIRFYKNIDTVMLWRINPYLEKLDEMIGMKSVKESILLQVMYYLKGFHLKNKNEEYLHTMIMGSPGHGKCLKKDTPIIMYDGSTKMVQNIIQGDQIMGDDSNPRNILSTCTGKEMMYKIKQEYGDDYIVNKSHIISLKLSKNPRIIDTLSKNNIRVVWYTKEKINSKNFNYSTTSMIYRDKCIVYQKALKFIKTLPKKGTVIDIELIDYIKRPELWKKAWKGFKVGIDFPNKPVEFDPYTLGVWLGGGCGNNISDNFIKPILVKYLRRKNKHEQDYNFFKGFEKYTDKLIPIEYKINSESVRLSLLAGLIDSNGQLFNDYYEIVEINKVLADDILFLTRSLGFCSNMKECENTYMHDEEIKKYTYYRITFSGNINKIPVLTLHKKSKDQKQIEDHLYYDIQIEQLEVDNYYGFMIDGNHRFLLGDFTVTHNTEIAKIIGKLYQAMGILSSSGPFKIAYRDDFIAGYLGQTAIKTKKLLKSCIGGVLFVDEVYSLGPGQSDKDSFSKECIETITGFLSDHKNDFCFIGAGYEDDIKKCFFKGNKGLERRFQWNHKIDKYNEDNLTDIMLKMVKEIGWEISVNRNDIIDLIKTNLDLFKNAGGDIETFLSKCKNFHAKRVFALDLEHMFVLTKDDLLGGIELSKKYRLDNKAKESEAPYGMYT